MMRSMKSRAAVTRILQTKKGEGIRKKNETFE